MVESKQVRVDNWGVFFLQRLQVFFSKTDYCDLTLQFEGNVQLKVHRLVMNACTEYFTYLEQSCATFEENTIMMPPDLQADVIVPIVNFMYTGMLEFHMPIFERLYKAAELMNITVLTKLLDAQKAHSNFKTLNKKKPESPHIWNLQGPKPAPKTHKSSSTELPPTLPGRKLPVWKRKTVPSHPSSQLQCSEQRFCQDPLSLHDSTPKPTRFEWPDEDLPPLMDSTFEDISYTSKPLLTQEEENRASTSFDDVRKSANNDQNKDDSDYSDYSQQKRKLDQSAEKTSPKRAKLNDKENKETTISIKSSNGTDLDHTKIVSEILKKYPQLVKKNKNIRLKIMASGNKNVIEQPVHTPVKTPKMKVQVEAAKAKVAKPVPKPRVEKSSIAEEGPWVCTKCTESGELTHEFVLYYLYRKHMTDIHNETFDTRLCKYCGHWCGKHNLMMYHLYTKHGLKPPTTYNFPKCDQCPYIALSTQKLTQHKLSHDPEEMQCVDCHLAFTCQQTLTAHIQITGHLNRGGNNSYDCQYCTKRLQSAINLFSHIKNSHLKEAKRDGIVILDEMEDIDDIDAEEDTMIQKDKVKIISNVKVPLRSEQTNTNIQQATQLEPSSEAEALSNVASGIATSLGLVDIVVLDDNQQYILQQQEDHTQSEFILPDLTTGENHFAGQVITTQHSTVIPQSMLQTSGSDITSTDELVMVLTDHDYQDEQEGATADNSNIVVLYSHPVGGQQGQFITSQGNLLVNSQTGMLEIRNDAITTTAANQMVVNTVDTTESIESIQREIESHRQMKHDPYYQTETRAMVQLPQPNSELIVQPQPEEEPQPEPSEETESTMTQNIDQGTTTENLPMENYQEEEEVLAEQVEENEDVKKEVEAEYEQGVETTEDTHEEKGDDSNVEPCPETVDGASVALEEPDPMEIDETEQPVSEDRSEKEPDQNLTLESISEEETPVSTEETTATESIDVPPSDKNDSLYESSESFVFNDPSKVGDIESPEKSETIGHVEEDTSEAMEVDGKVSDQQQEREEEADVVEEESAERKQEEVEEHVQLEESKESATNENEDGNTTELIDQPPLQEEVSESEYQHQSETDNSQYNEDEDDNSQSSRGTAQSQEISADNRNQANINQAILEDWDDTDSQQSEKQRAAMKQAAENVNKLMDDWEEEDDEDDKKEGD